MSRGVCPRGCSAPASSDCAPSRASHQSSSVPISVTRLSSVTGTTAIVCRGGRLGSASSVTSSGPSSSRSSPQSSISVPGGSPLRIVELRNRNSAGSPTDSPNSRPAIGALVPSSMPNGTTHSAFSGAGKPGHRRQRALDADVVAARGAAADADAASAGARLPVVRRAARDRVIEIRRVEHVRRVERRRIPPARSQPFSTSTIRARSASAFITPPLNSTCVGQARPLGPRRIARRRRAAGRLPGEEARQVARHGRVRGVRQPELLEARRAGGAPASRRPRRSGRTRRPAPGSRRRGEARL